MDRYPKRAKFPGLNILAKPICALFNLSINLSQGVQMLAVAKLKAIFKKGKTDHFNYSKLHCFHQLQDH